jgi:hypothetical protein
MSIGSKTLLIGASGAGKTTAIGSLAKTGLETFCIFTDPNYHVLGQLSCKDGMHKAYLPPADMTFDALYDAADKVSKLTVEALCAQKSADKGNYTQFLKLITLCRNYKCDVCAKEFGAIDSWGTDRAFVLDGLSGLSIMSRDLTVGSKPAMHPGEWGIAQNNVEKFVQKCATGLKAHFVLIAHLEKEIDEVAGTSKLMASTLGRKLAPKLPWMFSDVILATREGAKFGWSTDMSGVDVKPTNLPRGSNLEPSFVPLIKRWKDAQPVSSTPVLVKAGT